ncbi:MAG: ubiquitin-protein ligase MIB2-like [Verrucomicrobiales bacterium]|jgi:ankyrin repeat protein|nr:ubiquitin-protein ligase MIB2-like [Verrucomicrobiales bacterium]
MNALLTAIVDDDRSTVKKLLKADAGLVTELIAEPRLFNSGIFHWIYAGDTALHLAVAGYRVGIVRLLLAAGADPNSRMNHRLSGPLHYAADGFIAGPDWEAGRQVETIQCLLAAGAKINSQDKNGATPLHRAVRTRCSAAVKFLIESGADISICNKSGSTAFHLAVQNTGRGGSGAESAIAAQREIILEFLARGEDPAKKMKSGKSVLESARSGWIRELLG